MEQVQEKFQEKFQVLRSKLDKIPALDQAENVTKVPKEYLVAGGGCLLLIVIFYGIGAAFVCNLVGFIHPAYMTLKSMESSSSKQVAEDSTLWLTYWVIFSSLNVAEGLFTFIVKLIPFYYGIKMGFIIWLYHPKTAGAEVLYNQVVRPKILPYLEATKKAE